MNSVHYVYPSRFKTAGQNQRFLSSGNPRSRVRATGVASVGSKDVKVITPARVDLQTTLVETLGLVEKLAQKLESLEDRVSRIAAYINLNAGA